MVVVEREHRVFAGIEESPELLFPEARRRRRRRWLAAVAGIVGLAMVVTASLFAVVAGSSHPGGPQPSTSEQPNLPPAAPGAPSSPAASVATALGRGPTSIYFLTSSRGWIATGCAANCYETRPTIVTTSDGGRSWHVMPSSPDIGSIGQTAYTWFHLGGQVQLRFATPQRGWYLQAGELWRTGDGGRRWTAEDLGGVVVALTGSNGSAWALVSHCPRFPLSCSDLELFRWTRQDPGWTRLAEFSVGTSDPADGASLVSSGGSAFVSTASGQYAAAAVGGIRRVSDRCRAIPNLASSGAVGICGVRGDGGDSDAAAVSLATITDGGSAWRPVLGGPPSDGWTGDVATNGAGTIWYVVHGSMLWRTTISGKSWSVVYRTVPNTTDELYPVVFAGPNVGFMGESGSGGLRLLKTTDTGLTWTPIPVRVG